MKNEIEIIIKCINKNNTSGFLLVLNEQQIEHYDIHLETTTRRDKIDNNQIMQLVNFVYKNADKIITVNNDKTTTPST
tara:strand:+ start:56 stop:289 length:234 start_codon:yes stop_codon:yes gene_type:complete